MRSVYGVIDLLPDLFVQLLPRSVTATYEFQIQADVVLIPTIELFKLHYKALERRKRIMVVVFDSPELLKSWNIPLLECSRQSVRKALATPNQVRYKPYNPIQRMLSASTGSFISSLATMVYKVKDPDRQLEIKNIVFTALCENRVPQLAGRIVNAPELRKLILSDDAGRLAAALQEVLAGKPVKQAATQHGVAAFDIQYSIKFYERLKS